MSLTKYAKCAIEFGNGCKAGAASKKFLVPVRRTMASRPMKAKVPMPKENINNGRWRPNLNSCQVNVFASMSEVWAVESPTKNWSPMVEMAVTKVSRSGSYVTFDLSMLI